jgi:tRNA nucleotidyltransferase/poly(A) polymerase
MDLRVDDRLNVLFAAVRRETPPEVAVYLVGGVVRDLLLGRPVHDVDLILTGAIRQVAHRVTDALHGDFYLMDDERDTVRVIVHPEDGEAIYLDFCALRAETLDRDLRDRDFTVNAIALDLRQMDLPVDPMGGVADLRAGVLRACSPGAFLKDPVRVMRGVRLSFSLGFTIEPATLEHMRQAAGEFRRVSTERLRDELLRILEGRRPADALRLLDQLGGLAFLLPELAGMKAVTQSPPHHLDVWEHTLRLIAELEGLWQTFVEGCSPETQSPLTTALACLEPYRPALAAHFHTAITPNRSLRGLLFLAGLYHDAAKPEARTVEPGGRIRFLRHEEIGAAWVAQRARNLALSQVEAQRIEVTVRQHMRIHLLADSDEKVTRRAIFRYFRDTGPAGVDIVLLSLADVLATYGDALDPQVWQNELETARLLLAAWFDQPEQSVKPPRLITGDDLMRELRLAPGPQIGRLLAAIQEAQAVGEVTSYPQAVEFARQQL